MVENANLLVVGLARDISHDLSREIAKIEKQAKAIFDTVQFFIVESDSKNDTVNLLQKIKKERSNFDFISLASVQHRYPERFSRLRHCRNQYIKAIRTRTEYKTCSFVLVVDFDLKNNRLNLEPIKDLIPIDAWEGLFANQTGPYYDILALRKEGWVVEDCFANYSKLATSLGREKAKHEAIWSKMKRIPLSSPVISVDSAFGGMGLYRRRVFEKFDYCPTTLEQSLESEHVALNNKITLSGGKLFILPRMTNFSYSTHNLLSYKFFRRIDHSLASPKYRAIRRIARRLLA
jgi:hypothetical protein